jgi:hypothetical protein
MALMMVSKIFNFCQRCWWTIRLHNDRYQRRGLFLGCHMEKQSNHH